MKETTKDQKAMVDFKKVAKTCKNSWINLQDNEFEITGSHYTCNVITEDNECIVYKDFGGLNKYLVESFKI